MSLSVSVSFDYDLVSLLIKAYLRGAKMADMPEDVTLNRAREYAQTVVRYLQTNPVNLDELP